MRKKIIPPKRACLRNWQVNYSPRGLERVNIAQKPYIEIPLMIIQRSCGSKCWYEKILCVCDTYVQVRCTKQNGACMQTVRVKCGYVLQNGVRLAQAPLINAFIH